MMKKIPEERKEAILAKRSGLDRKPVASVAAKGGISTATLYNWGKRARREGRLLREHNDSPEGWSVQNKFQCYKAKSVDHYKEYGNTERTERSARNSFLKKILCALCGLCARKYSACE